MWCESMQTLVIGVECHCGRTGWKLNVKNAQGENSHKHAPNHKCRRVYILCHWIVLSVRWCDAENEEEKSRSERAILNVNRILSLSFIKYASNRHLNPTNGNVYVWKKYCAINHIYRKLNRQMINDIGVEIKTAHRKMQLTHTYTQKRHQPNNRNNTGRVILNSIANAIFHGRCETRRFSCLFVSVSPGTFAQIDWMDRFSFYSGEFIRW